MRVFNVENVEAAIELAAALKGQGRYDWFRGQVEGWNPASSLERKLTDGTTTQESYIAEVKAFMRWASNVPELAYLTRDGGEDAACAILQHHGMPTQYIDFTTEPSVAGFFSADAPLAPPPGTKSMILCLQTRDLLNFYEGWKTLKPELQLEAVSVDVANLWRLQAQRGCFIYANHPWYKIYDLDRIVFPWTGYPAYPQREQIYPAHKSALERRLDEYVSVKRRREGTARAREMMRDGPVVWIDYTEQSDNSAPAAAQVVEQWSQRQLMHWTQHAIERYDTTIGSQRLLHLREGPGVPPMGVQVSVALASILRKESGLRNYAVDWSFIGLPDVALAASLSKASRTLWNGLRCLPASDQDLANAFGTLVALYVARGAQSVIREQETVELVFTAPIYVEFATRASVVSRGYCASDSLLEAVSSHWQQAHAQAPGGGMDHVTPSRLLSNNKPSQVFEFERFARVFVRQIVPSQIVLRRDPVIFNPAELSVFGLP